MAELTHQGVAHHLSSNDAVECSELQWNGVNAVAHQIRDGCFHWYVSWFQSPSSAQEFLGALRKSDLPFHLEHHKDRLVFLLAKQHESDYNDLLAGGFP